MFSTLTAITSLSLTRPPVSGSTGWFGFGFDVGDAVGAGLAGAEVTAGAVNGSLPDRPSEAPTATPPPIKMTTATTQPIVYARFQTNLRGHRVGAHRHSAPPARPWHILNFLPDPQGHGALRPTPAYGSSAVLAGLPAVLTEPSSPGAE